MLGKLPNSLLDRAVLSQVSLGRVGTFHVCAEPLVWCSVAELRGQSPELTHGASSCDGISTELAY